MTPQYKWIKQNNTPHTINHQNDDERIRAIIGQRYRQRRRQTPTHRERAEEDIQQEQGRTKDTNMNKQNKHTEPTTNTKENKTTD